MSRLGEEGHDARLVPHLPSLRFPVLVSRELVCDCVKTPPCHSNEERAMKHHCRVRCSRREIMTTRCVHFIRGTMSRGYCADKMPCAQTVKIVRRRENGCRISPISSISLAFCKAVPMVGKWGLCAAVLLDSILLDRARAAPGDGDELNPLTVTKSSRAEERRGKGYKDGQSQILCKCRSFSGPALQDERGVCRDTLCVKQPM